MELVQKNIHFSRISKQARNQITVEEDVNIPDTKEDIESILFHNQKVMVDEVKVNDQKVHIRGRLMYTILYCSEESGRLCSLEGSIPVEEKLYMEGIENTDKVTVKICMEDFSVGIINSRKISIQSLLDIHASVQELYDEQMTTDLQNEVCEVQKKECPFTQLAVCKKDVFRVRENLSLPSNMPNIEEVLWKNISVQEFECKTLDGQLEIQGKVYVFILYEGERQNRPQIYQMTMPFGTTLECSGCENQMIPDISYDMTECQVHVESDFDGEDRSFGVEMTFEVDMKIYATEKVDVLWDTYGIQKELIPEEEEVRYDVLTMSENGCIKVTDTWKVPEMEGEGIQILYSQGECFVEKCEAYPEGISIQGMLVTQILFKQENADNVYGSHQRMIPFEQVIEYPPEIQGQPDLMKCYVNPKCTTVQLQYLGEQSVELRANIFYHLLAFETVSTKNIKKVESREMDVEKCNHLPSMAIYFAKSEDTLWEMGKKYCVPIKQIKEMNQMTSDEMKAGDRILIVRGMGA